MAEKTLYIHIGLYKTGSTSIQNFCWDNNSAFANFGYCYPDLGFRYKGKSPRRNGTFLTQPYERLKKNGEKDFETEDEVFRFGMNQVEALFDEYDNIILSDEAIFRNTADRKPALWKELKKRADERKYTVKAVVYLRRQDEFVESYWNQRIKQSVVLSSKWEEYLEDGELRNTVDYYHVLNRISESIGKENVILRRFGKKTHLKQSLQEEFLNAVGLPLDESFVLTEDMKRKNKRLSLNLLEMKRIANECRNPDTVNFVRKALVKAEIDPGRKETVFPKEEAVEFLKKFEEGNRRIAEEYIGDGEPLFEELSDDLPVWKKGNDNTADDMIRFQMAILDAVLRENEKLKSKIETLEKNTKKQEKRLEKQETRHFRMLDVLKHPWKALSK